VNPHTRVVKGETLVTTFSDVGQGWEQWVLVTSDRHWDSVHTDRTMQKRHLDQAVERDALIMDLGDVFDAMQGKDDKRGSKASIRPEHVRSDYFDGLVETAAEFFEPYADRILVLGTGNHETAVLKHHEINLSWQLARALNASSGDVHFGRYSGYVKFQYRSNEKTYRRPCLAYYHHGHGGSSPVTRGVIQTNRRAVYLTDPDVIFTGHTHQSWIVPISRERVSDQGRTYVDQQWHVQVPSYKEASRREGWEAEKGMAPTMKGAIWWRMYYRDLKVHHEYTWAQ